jgi:hypothetical protein
MLRDFPESLAGMFRLFMTAGQLFSKQGDLRIEFYNSVLERADNVSNELYSAPPLQTVKIASSSKGTKLGGTHRRDSGQESRR